MEVKLLPQAGELYVLARSADRVNKERSIRRRQLKRLWQRLGELQAMELSRDQLRMIAFTAAQAWGADHFFNELALDLAPIL